VPVPALALLDIRTLLVIGDVSMPPSRRTANRDLLQSAWRKHGVSCPKSVGGCTTWAWYRCGRWT